MDLSQQGRVTEGTGSDGAVFEKIAIVGFSDSSGATRSLRRIRSAPEAGEFFAVFAPHLLNALASAGSPDRVLATFERFLQGAADPLATYRFLAAHPRSVEMMVRLFSGSQFLAEILLRNPEYFEDLIDLRRLAQRKSRETLLREMEIAAAPYSALSDRLDAFRRTQRRELLRIGTCDLLDLYDLPAATMQLSNLADALVQACLDAVSAHALIDPDGFCVIGMGKLGGQELNYSSDIDFLFLAETPSPAITRLGERLVDALSRVTTEGFLYRVDMRLRPWGKVGPLVSSPDGFIGYLNKHALQWEKQALLKARVIAGNRQVGQSFIRQVQPFLFGGAAETVRADVFAMKQRTEAFLQERGRAWGDVKLGEGSIRDVEFVTQFLQMANGAERPQVINSNTLESLDRLRAVGLLTAQEVRVLSSGYIFLRTIEHHLQMMDYRQTHTLPDDPEAIVSLARRLGFEDNQADAKFLVRYSQHATAIREVYLRHVGRIEMEGSNRVPTGEGENASRSPSGQEVDRHTVDRHRARMSPSYAGRFSEAEITRHAALAGQLDSERLVVVDPREVGDGTWEVAIVAYDFPGELSLICGLMYVYGLDIIKGDVFTYDPPVQEAAEVTTAPRMTLRERARLVRQSATGQNEPRMDAQRKIVDVFTVRPVRGGHPTPLFWMQYADELNGLLRMLRLGQGREARGAVARRVGASLIEAGHSAQSDSASAFAPLEIEIDNETSDETTVLRIDTPDIVGFLYEFTNALALNQIYIASMEINTIGSRVRDTLYVTDENGQKITQPDRLRELRAATVLIKHFTHLLPYSPNPESALLHFREFIAQLFHRPNWPDELASLERPEVLRAMARLLGVSDFLWDDFLRMQYVNLYPVVTDVDALATAKTRAELEQELQAILAEKHPGPQPPSDDAPWREALNAFKDREMFRIDMRHILGHTKEFWEFATELSDLAEVVVNAAYHLCHEDLRSVYGTPLLENGEPSEMSVCALGKCGGRELGFASDIELMFLYSGNGRTTGPQVISTTEFYEKLVTDFVRAIRAKREGIFEVDLRLRPYGKAGSLAVPLESFRRYFAPEGAAWAYERQALVKLRPVAGNPGLGERIIELRDQYVYTGEAFDAIAMRAMRERQVRHMVSGGKFNLKYSPGGLVDVEYLIQGLQITYGKDHPELRQTNTRDALAALADTGILTEADATKLRKAHTFLRWLIDSMRVVRGNARDVTMPVEGSEEYAFLARRMLYGADLDRLRDEMNRHTASVQEINARLLK